jgi:hypothetical protein
LVEQHIDEFLLLAAVSHRHVVFTIPRLLRPLFRRRRELLIELAHAAAAAIFTLMQESLGGGVQPGLVARLASAGDLVQWHPHLHVVATSGAFSVDGVFHPLDGWDAQRLMILFREYLLARLLEHHAVSELLVTKLKAWAAIPRPWIGSSGSLGWRITSPIREGTEPSSMAPTQTAPVGQASRRSQARTHPPHASGARRAGRG